VRGIRIGLFALGIDPDRITFEQATSRSDHLARYAAVDVSLDPFPHCGGVTTLESILMGVPVITLKGDSLCGRGGTSLMQTLNLQVLIASAAEEYVWLAQRMDKLTLPPRPAIRKRLLDSILVDRERYTAALEDAYRSLWRTWCRSH
jgi:predicted O-linked N-acetylglucosamine transferase (SPINDLY family)